MPHKRKNAKAARSAPEGFSLAFLQQCGMGNKARSEEISFGGRKKILKFLSDLIGATPIRDCAPQIRTGTEKRRNWQSYAERTANYAFGYAGDRDLQRNANYIELWQKIELRQDSVHANAEARLR